MRAAAFPRGSESSTPSLPKLPHSSQIEAKPECRVKMRPGVQSHQTALRLSSFCCPALLFPGSATSTFLHLNSSQLPHATPILALRMRAFHLQSTHARLLSRTLVSRVMFGYQCFIFINREFSNIAYYIHIYTHICKQINTPSHSSAPRLHFNHLGRLE